jgi:hypothetical protein
MMPLTARAESGPYYPRKKTLRMAFALYIAALSVDAVRKVAGLSTVANGIIFLVVGLTYLILLPGTNNRIRPVPRYLRLWLVLLSFWCLIEALVPRIPPSMAILGWVSYIFFVPLVYVGAELMATDRGAAQTLRIVAVGGAVVGLGATASALLGQSAPTILQPIVSTVGFHSFSTGNIYLAPSIFATAEEAAEELLIALFAWLALSYLPSARPTRVSSAITGILIAVGLFATARRADIVMAVAGLVTLIILGRPAFRDGAGRPAPRAATRTLSRSVPALILGIVGSVALISALGASKIVPFLTSRSDGQSTLALMFSSANPGSLAGQGTGTSTQGASVVGATLSTTYRNYRMYTGYIQDGKTFITAEGGLTKTWLELGIVGVLLYAAVFASVVGPAARALRRLDGVGRTLTILTITLGVIFLKGHQSLDDPLVQPLFWLAAGGAWGRMRTLSAAQRKPQGPDPAAPVGVYTHLSTPQTHTADEWSSDKAW